jgi:hypothetical protein
MAMGRTDARLRCAVPDDFQNAATEIADWSPAAEAVDVVLFGTHNDDADIWPRPSPTSTSSWPGATPSPAPG